MQRQSGGQLIQEGACFPISSSLFQRAWPWAMLILALVVTVAWAALLAYGCAELVEKALS
jgi:hypothetical protein